jgi:hypothetical protein
MLWTEFESDVSLTWAEIQAFVGRNSDYYLRAWATAIGGLGRVRGFNRAAFLLTIFWLPYRKMYRITWMYYGIIALATVIEVTLPATGLIKTRTLWLTARIFSAMVSVACGAYGNAWYSRHTQREIFRIRELNLDHNAHLAALARRGGTSIVMPLVTFVLFLVLMYFVCMGLAFVLSQN